MSKFSVVLSSASFNPGTPSDSSKGLSGEFSFILLIDDKPSTSLVISSSVSSSSPSQLIQQAQGDLKSAFQGWAESLSSSPSSGI
ncbi:hypothetical protein [Vitiosangium sp. GDMCC 1.1324]|uniref:hypothetical protein n=1 Tax=Vitiosangium sp. (strain GDMCC 1.1324) TaxID=2138576 RepID=UPI000D352C88|nr:hypothetical protein [Vitiosangium sp. GDMCC 1.1324]PTL81596.1 hypothetical protein DAT35_21805 [Vitiosangium sp. GDMCC 1.1324]